MAVGSLTVGSSRLLGVKPYSQSAIRMHPRKK
jgi:hypothetical protein